MAPRRLLTLALAVVVGSVTVHAAAAAPTLRSPGVRKPAARLATKPVTAVPPTELSGSGEHPDVIVDAAGTAHIVWNEPVDGGPDVTVYCRVPRAAKACDVTQRLVPPGANELSDDADGPQVSAVNDQVVVVSHRYPQPVPKPGGDGSTDDDTLYLWSSDDGGRTFVGPGVSGTATIGGDAEAFGPDPNNPSLGTITGVATGGIRFTGFTGGRFQPASALLAEGNFADGRLTVIDRIPTVAYHDLGTTSFVRTWTGQGDVNDAATWGPPTEFQGLEPEISAAAGRLVAIDKKPDGSGDLELRDVAGGAARVISTGQAGNDAVPIGHPDGSVTAIWQGTEDNVSGIWRRERIQPAGPIRGTPSLVSTVVGSFLAADATDDGGGVAVRDTNDKKILLSGFGTTLPTEKPGLGGQPGGGAPPADVAVECQKVQLGPAVQALIQDPTCFLNAQRAGVKVSDGPLRLNGIDIVPDAGVQVQIDLNKRTIASTGTVSLLLRAPGVPDITLFRGKLDLDAKGKGVGDALGTFGEKLFKPDLLGFPLRGDIDLKLAPPDGVRIPISLELPKELGDIRGSAELILDNRRGLVLDSLDFSADGVPLGPAMMRRLRVQYRATGGTAVGDCLKPPSSGAQALPNEWAGVFELELPPPKTGPSVCGSIRFGAPEGFREATFRIDLPFPGIPLFPGLSLTSLGGGLRLAPRPARVDGTFRLEVAGAAPDVSVAQMDGRIGVELSDPLVLRGQATVTASGIRIGTGEITVTSDGYAAARLTAGPTIKDFRIAASVAGFIDAPRHEFSIYGKGSICWKDLCLDGSEGAISTKGIAFCLPVIRPAIPIPFPPFAIVPPRGAGYDWGGSLEIWPQSCYASRYTVPDQRAAALGDPPTAEAGADIPAGMGATFRVTGAGGVPEVDLIGPAGQAVTPDADFPDTDSGTRYLAVTAPSAGRWTVRARPGSALIAELAVSRDRTAPKVDGAQVSGKGRTRTLAYRATFADDQAVTFVERGRAGSRVLGAATAGAGRLSFTPGPGPGGPREIVAQLMQDGLVRQEAVVGRYTAPQPPRVGTATGLRLRRAGTSVVVTWRPGANAAAQRLVVRVPNGPLVSQLLGGRASRAVVAGIDRRQVTAAVTAIAASGRRAATARATLAPAPAPKKG